jgi:UDP-2,4-diacetamido-2,4,6-trideoxy-beta-L-altropyranose hydrolase
MMPLVSTILLGGYLKRTDQKITFRVDASSQIGTGHFMRCLTLANKLKQCGAQIRFISRHLPEHLRDLLAKEGIKFILLDNNGNPAPIDELAHAQWLGTSQMQDAQATINALSDELWDWLIVDHYALDTRWESLLRQTAKKIMVIDDIADRHHNCDLLLDQNFYADMNSRYNYKVPSHCQLLLGPHHALLRDEFRQLQEQIKPRSGPVKRILVFFGGVDADNYTGCAIEALSRIDIPDLHVDVVIGAQHPCREEINATCVQHGFICHVQTDRMAGLMAAADLAIGAGGTTTWERFCLGLPSIVISTAANQKRIAEDCCRCGCHLYLGDSSEVSSSDISAAIKTAFRTSFLLQHMAEQASIMVDGKGTLRVIQVLVPPRIILRLATSGDCENIYRWRNAEETRLGIFNKEIIPFEVHQRWFEKSLENKNCILLIGDCDNEPLGVLRYDLKKEEALISVYLVPGLKTMGTGSQLIQAGSNWLRKNRPDVKKINAEIISTNIASRKAFQKAEYSLNHFIYSKEFQNDQE